MIDIAYCKMMTAHGGWHEYYRDYGKPAPQGEYGSFAGEGNQWGKSGRR
jgi:hypothetical protein